MKALTKPFKMRMRITCLNYFIGDELQYAALFMQPQCAVDRARVRHLARHPEVNLNLLTMIDILNESPDQALQYSRKHFYLLMSRSSYNKGRKVKPASTNVHVWITLKSRESALEHKLALITKMSISNESIIDSLHDFHLHLWQSWRNRWKYWASSPKLSPTGADEKHLQD